MMKHYPDFILLSVVLILVSFGTIMIFSASSFVASNSYGDNYYFLKRHLIKVVLALIVMFVMMNIDYRIYQRIVPFIVGFAFLSLLIVLIPGIGGKSAHFTHSKRWINLGPINVQPMEIAKIAFIIYLADLLHRKQEDINSFANSLLPAIIILAGMFFLLLLEPAFGGALVIAFIAVIMFFVAGIKLNYIIGLGLLAIPLCISIIAKAKYRLDRIRTFLDPSSNPDKGYQIQQSLIGLGTGGIIGCGLGHGHQKLYYLPEPYSDFIFSVIGEELGFVGTVALIGLFIIILWRGLKIALDKTDVYSSLLAMGITISITISAIINIAVVTGSIPTTGLPLPFISYGGSSLLFNMMQVGILLNISMQDNDEKNKIKWEFRRIEKSSKPRRIKKETILIKPRKRI